MTKNAFTRWCKQNPLFVAAFALKVCIGLWFSSDFKDLLFIPFITEYISTAQNPWATFLAAPSSAEFPYHPIMLYIMSLFYAPVVWLNLSSPLLTNLFFKLPLLISDIVITATLLGFFPHRKRHVLVFYVLSPIVFYASYLHSQLDLITTALFMVSLFTLYKGRGIQAGLWLGLAISSKLHIVIALPLLCLYVLRQFGLKSALKYTLSCLGVYLFVTGPYLLSPGFVELVLNNPKQSLILNAALDLSGTYSIYTSIAIILLVVLRFGMYKKTNIDLLFSYCAILFSIPVLLVLPRPGWYVWAVPFVSIFLITANAKRKEMTALYLGLKTVFCIFFLFFYDSDIAPLTWFGTPIPPAITSTTLQNLVFTLLEVSLFALILSCYQYGVRSNDIYKRSSSILLGIGGDSGSGKTTLLSDITSLLKDKTVGLETDGIHKWERGNKQWESHTHLDPKANHLHSFTSSLRLLKRGDSAPFRFYDHDTGTFTEPKKIKPNDIVLLSGLHPFYLPALRKLIDIKLFLATQESLRHFWKVKRDTSKRGYSVEDVQAQLKQREAESEKHIATQKQFADIVVSYITNDDLSDFTKEKDDINLSLSITCSSDVDLDLFLDQMQQLDVLKKWDYQDDLHTVHMEFNGSVPAEQLSHIAEQSIENLNEIISPDAQWQPDYRGIIQYIIIATISKELKAGN